jgi:2-oxoglutarate dehydrogenase E2 component (dihydrolipoamide succinyltransferase)
LNAVEAPGFPGAAAPATPAPAASAPAPAQRPTGGFSVPAYHPGENVTIVPMDRIRERTMGHMVYSKATSAHVTTVFHVDLSRITAIRSKWRCRAAA